MENQKQPTSQYFFIQKKQTTIKELQKQQKQGESLFSQQHAVTIPGFRLDMQQIKNKNQDQNFYLQVRGDYLVQASKFQVKKGTRNIIKDKIISYLQFDKTMAFEYTREFQQQLQPLPPIIGIKIFLRTQKTLLCQLIAAKYEQRQDELQEFGKTLQKKMIVQNCFHKMFKPLKKLGKGASSLVIQGYSIRDKKSFAIKGFKKSKGYSVLTGIFSKQYEVLRQLNHQNIVTLHAVHESQKSLYMVFDKFQFTLLDFLNYRGIKTEDQLKKILKGVLKGLQYIHSKGIMHRDIKLENIMVKQMQGYENQTQNSHPNQRKTIITPILIDFGFAQYEQNQQYILHRCGTPGYVAPQILQNYKTSQNAPDSFNSQNSTSKKRYGKSCDIFSLGCAFHIILTKKMLFQGETKSEVLRKNSICEIDRQKLEYKTLDVVAKKLMFKMLQVDSIKRISASSALKDQFFNLVMFNFKPLTYKFYQTVSLSEKIKQQYGTKQEEKTKNK